jgi:hypothetical protein
VDLGAKSARDREEAGQEAAELDVIFDSAAPPRACGDVVVVPLPITVEDRAVQAHEVAHVEHRAELAHPRQWRREAKVSEYALRELWDRGHRGRDFDRAARCLARHLHSYIADQQVPRWLVQEHVPAALDWANYA